jgi:hypothetical protein
MKHVLEYLHAKGVLITENSWIVPDWHNQKYYGEQCWGIESHYEFTLPIGRVILEKYTDKNGSVYILSIKFFMI